MAIFDRKWPMSIRVAHSTFDIPNIYNKEVLKKFNLKHCLDFWIISFPFREYINLVRSRSEPFGSFYRLKSVARIIGGQKVNFRLEHGLDVP